MQLGSLEFGPCWVAAGTLGFFGNGYWFHRLPFVSGWYEPLHTRAVFVAKTTTTDPCKGHMPLYGPERDFEPREFFPKCIWADRRRGIALNAVGLSGPGARSLFQQGKWQARRRPFMLSWMPIGDESTWERQARQFVAQAKRHLYDSLRFNLQFALQFNVTCPNTGVDLSKLLRAATMLLDILGELDVPLVVKLNVLADPKEAAQLSQHPKCSALCIGNTVPFGAPVNIDWLVLFPDGSPLRKRDQSFGDGGLSGKLLPPLVANWLNRAWDSGLRKPVNACGGVTSPADVDYLVQTAGLRRGIDSVSLGSIAMLAPWRIPETVERVRETLG